MSDDERVKLYSGLIQSEQKRIAESKERIAEWAYQLEQAARAAAVKDQR